MKLMMYGMPIMFFFVLYDVPSGLLIYWIVSNVLTIVQQMVINDMLKKHKLAGGVGAFRVGRFEWFFQHEERRERRRCAAQPQHPKPDSAKR